MHFFSFWIVKSFPMINSSLSKQIQTPTKFLITCPVSETVVTNVHSGTRSKWGGGMFRCFTSRCAGKQQYRGPPNRINGLLLFPLDENLGSDQVQIQGEGSSFDWQQDSDFEITHASRLWPFGPRKSRLDCLNTRTHTQRHTRTHTHAHTHRGIHAHTHRGIHAHTHAHTHTHRHEHTHTNTHVYTHTHTHARTGTHTHIKRSHAHTHTQEDKTGSIQDNASTSSIHRNKTKLRTATPTKHLLWAVGGSLSHRGVTFQ